jgi:hypothetical protein
VPLTSPAHGEPATRGRRIGHQCQCWVWANLTFWRRHLANATSHLDGLQAASQAIPADKAEIEQARRAAEQRRNAMTMSFRPPDERGSIAALAALVRRLITENDPDVVRAGLSEIASALEAMESG